MQLFTPWEDASLPLLLTVVRSRLRQVSWRMLLPYGITPQQYQVVMTLSDHPGLSHGRLAAALGFDKPTATRIIQAVQAKGWLEATHPPDHGRRLVLRLTPEGEDLARRLGAFRATMRQEIEKGLDPAERRQIRTLLRRVAANLDALDEQQPTDN